MLLHVTRFSWLDTGDGSGDGLGGGAPADEADAEATADEAAALELEAAVEGDYDAEALADWAREDREAHDEALVERAERGVVQAAFADQAPSGEALHRAMQEAAGEGHADLEAEALLNLAQEALDEDGVGAEEGGESEPEPVGVLDDRAKLEEAHERWLMEAQAGLFTLLDRESALRDKPLGYCTVFGRPDLALLQYDTTTDTGCGHDNRSWWVNLSASIVRPRKSVVAVVG